MIKIIKLSAIIFLSILAVSCGKKNKKEVKPVLQVNPQVDNSSSRYWPLAVGNKWQYDGYTYDYEISITGKKVMNNIEYYDAYNSYSKQSGYLRYQDGKYYNSGNYNGSIIELLLLDENATVGSKWKMGEITIKNSGVSATSVYNCEVTEKAASMEIGGVTYNNVFVVKMETSLKYTLEPEFTKYMTQEQIDYYQSLYSQMGP